ncbi:MAG TPA: gluconokinase [Mycobacteriales bacterium]|nr:gluconokinase [Mycobacteriales bacterium]
MARVVVLMGVSGSGKSTIGRMLARRLGCDFLEGDDLHSPQSIAKMHRGRPLTDNDRRPWLDAIALWIRDRTRRNVPGVVACSALKRSYRELLSEGSPSGSVLFVHLVAEPEELERRLTVREHFIAPSLLGPQLLTLEPPTLDEDAVTVHTTGSPDAVVREVERLVAA